MSRKYILVIDDDIDVLASLSAVLEIEGFDVVQKPTATAALAYLQSAPSPALILVDMRMPEMDGLDFCSRLERAPTLRSIPVVVMSADPVRVEGNVVGYLRKPFDIDRLLAAVAPYCRSGTGAN